MEFHSNSKASNWLFTGKTEDELIMIAIGPAPTRRRKRIKWLRRYRKMWRVAEEVAKLMSPDFSTCINLEAMAGPIGTIFYKDAL